MNLAKKLVAEEEKVELQMTSMIDVVFLLLIFFVTTMKFAAVEGNLPAYLPKKEKTVSTAQTKKPSDEEKELEDIVLRLSMQGGKVEMAVGSAILPNFRQLAFKLSRLHKQFPKHSVVLDAEPDVPFGKVVRALNACAAARYFNVSFAAPKKDVS